MTPGQFIALLIDPETKKPEYISHGQMLNELREYRRKMQDK